MAKKILLGLVVLLVVFLGYVSTKNGHFNYERSGLIQATPDRIFPYISNFEKGGEWSPYEKKDPNMKKAFSGTMGQVGSKMDFDGNKDAGSGSLEMLKVVPNESVEIKLVMTKPFHGENLITYRLIPEGNATRFSWAMSGDGGFLGKLMATLIDCEKMVTKDFELGINNLKQLVESQNPTKN